MIKHCKCKHEFQDSVYGKGLRLHTVAKDGTHRCTVCSGPARWIKRIELHAAGHEAKKHG